MLEDIAVLTDRFGRFTISIAGLRVALPAGRQATMRAEQHETPIGAAERRVRLVLRFGGVNVRAYAAILRTILTERLWLVPARSHLSGKESR